MKTYRRRAKPDSRLLARVAEHFDAAALKRVCEMEAADFETAYDMTRVEVNQRAPHDFYLHKSNGASVLFVAHLDTVEDDRTCNVMDTSAGPLVASGALDDRLGAYVGLELLTSLGCQFDYLLTVGEEQGLSTAAFFDPDHHDVAYNWVIEFDRMGTDVVLYQYDDGEFRALVEESGALVEEGIFSDISYLEHLGVKCANWGVGYRDYHGPRSHAWLADTFEMVTYFLVFHTLNRDIHLPHRPSPRDAWLGARFGSETSDMWDDYGYSGGYATREYVTEDCLEWVDDELNCSGTVQAHEFGPLCEGHETIYFGGE